MNICVYGASSNDIDKEYIKEGEKLGYEIAKRGYGLVFGGGAGGLMGAAARGAYSAGGKITGIAPSFFKKDGILFEHCTDFIFTETMRERKQTMEDMSDAFITTPGGIGTYEEFFEMLTLKQLGRHTKPMAVLNTNGYYDPIEDMLSKSIAEGFMCEDSRILYKFFDSVEGVLSYIESYKPVEFDILRKRKQELE